MFDVYIAADFSGSHNDPGQRTGIAYCEIVGAGEGPILRMGLTRTEVVAHVNERLLFHNQKGNRVLFGFDFQYSFPYGFWDHITGQNNNWNTILDGLTQGVQNVGLPAIVEDPQPNARAWAAHANNLFQDTPGPFWGANFHVQSRDPHFNFDTVPFSQYRHIEQLHLNAGFKSIFKIGGAGTVGLQSLCGIPHLRRIQQFCQINKIPLYCWPFDGMKIDPNGREHILVEFYPSLFQQGRPYHANPNADDAIACAEWCAAQDAANILGPFLNLNIQNQPQHMAIVQSEGWVIGLLP